MTPKEKEKLIGDILKASPGRDLNNGVFGRRFNAMNIAQKIFPIQELPPAAVPIYMKYHCDRCDGYFDSAKCHSTSECDVQISIDVMDS